MVWRFCGGCEQSTQSASKNISRGGLIMKHLREYPGNLRNKAIRASLAAAFLSTFGWAASSHAESAAAADSKKPDSDELKEIVVVSYKISRGSVGSLVDAPIEDVPRNIVAITEQTL